MDDNYNKINRFNMTISQQNRVQLLQVDVPSSRAPPRSPQSADPLAPHTAPYPGERSCIKEVVHYTLNQSAVAAGADLQDDPCADGSFMFRPVVGTNLHLLVLYRYRRRDAALNVNCHIRNRYNPEWRKTRTENCHSIIFRYKFFLDLFKL